MTDETTPQDGKAMPPASTGSVREPAAWGVMRVGGSWVSILANKVQAETSRKSFDKMENWVHEVVPLYRQPQPTLTDEEVEALKVAWQLSCSRVTPLWGEEKTFRSMLERLG